MSTPFIIMTEDSGIDVAVPADNVRVSKGDVRDNFRGASDSIESLQRLNGLAWQIALGYETMVS